MVSGTSQLFTRRPSAKTSQQKKLDRNNQLTLLNSTNILKVSRNASLLVINLNRGFNKVLIFFLRGSDKERDAFALAVKYSSRSTSRFDKTLKEKYVKMSHDVDFTTSQILLPDGTIGVNLSKKTNTTLKL